MNTSIRRLLAVLCFGLLLVSPGCVTSSSSDTPVTSDAVLNSPQVVALQGALQFGAYLAVKEHPEYRAPLVAVAKLMQGLSNDGQIGPLELGLAVQTALANESEDVRMGVAIALKSAIAIYGGIHAENNLADSQLRAVLNAMSESILAGITPGSTSLALPEV